MTIASIKKEIEDYKGQTLSFKFNGARNQIEEFTGTILNTYPGIFIIKLKNSNGLVKSFSYSDILTLHLEIKKMDKRSNFNL
ncbi:MAG: Veg family protein [Bacilli bacterium]